MNTDSIALEIKTLGRFSISANGKSVDMDWPDETMKVLFCSFLSPLDINFRWDRICRSMFDSPATRITRRRLEREVIRPLCSFLIKELGFNPLIAWEEGIRMDRQKVHVDALEFYTAVLEGVRLTSLANYPAAFEKFSRADTLYVGRYLPGMPGRIILSTSNELESLYRTSVLEGLRRAHSHYRIG